ncbi:MAG: GerMN domain-containing protein [Desulfobacterales bacterium]
MKPAKPRKLITALALPLAAAVWLLPGLTPVGAAQGGATAAGDSEARPSAVVEAVAHLYFADRRGLLLAAEARVMPRQTDACRRAHWLVSELIRGPRQGGLHTLPPESEVRALFLTPDETAYVDFSAAIQEHHPGGVRSELLSVYAVVNTLILNLPEVSAVKILIEGREVSTLAGHISLAAPLNADMLLIR